MTFIGKLFEEHMLFRRCVILILLWTNYAITYITFDYVIYATYMGVSGTDIVLAGGVIQAPFLAVLSYTIKKYNDVRCQK